MNHNTEPIILPPAGTFLPPEVSATDAKREAIRYLMRLIESGDGVTGLRTGFAALDRATAGLEQGRFWTIGARPGSGKTALALQLGVGLASGGHPVGVITLEQSVPQLMIRAALQASGCSRLDFLRDVGAAQLRVRDSLAKVAALPIRWADGPPVWAELRKLLALWSADGIEVVFLDYAQLLDRTDPAPRLDVVARISADMKQAAKEHGICIVALAQLNRIAATSAPGMHHLRESGCYEQDSDVVVLLDRHADDDADPRDPVATDLVVAKSRDGFCGRVPLVFHGPSYRFTEATEPPPAPPPTQRKGGGK